LRFTAIYRKSELRSYINDKLL